MLSRDRPLERGTYGIVVKAAVFPSSVEVEEAIETAVGSGTYGAFAARGRVESVSSDWTKWTSRAPSDGLKRKLRARHVRDGSNPSAYTADVIIDPTVSAPIPNYPLDGTLTSLLVDSQGRPVDSSQRNRCRLSNSGAQTLTGPGTTTLTWDTEVADSGGLHDGTNPSRITIPAGGDIGFWIFNTIINANLNAATFIKAGITKNGGAAGHIASAPPTAGGNYGSVSLSAVMPASVGDYFEVKVTIDGAGNGTTDYLLTFFEAHHLF